VTVEVTCCLLPAVAYLHISGSFKAIVKLKHSMTQWKYNSQ